MQRNVPAVESGEGEWQLEDKFKRIKQAAGEIAHCWTSQVFLGIPERNLLLLPLFCYPMKGWVMKMGSISKRGCLVGDEGGAE